MAVRFICIGVKRRPCYGSEITQFSLDMELSHMRAQEKVESKRLSPAASQRAALQRDDQLVRSLIRHYHAFEAASKNGLTLENLVQTVHDTAEIT